MKRLNSSFHSPAHQLRRGLWKPLDLIAKVRHILIVFDLSSISGNQPYEIEHRVRLSCLDIRVKAQPTSHTATPPLPCPAIM